MGPDTIKTQVKHVWPDILIYCFPKNITINNVSRECPPYVFRLNSTISWYTKDYKYSPRVSEFRKSAPDYLTNSIEMVHLPNATHYINDAQAYHKIRELIKENQKLGNISLITEINGHPIHYHHTTLGLGGILFGLFIYIIVREFILLKRFRRELIIRSRKRQASQGVHWNAMSSGGPTMAQFLNHLSAYQQQSRTLALTGGM